MSSFINHIVSVSENDVMKTVVSFRPILVIFDKQSTENGNNSYDHIHVCNQSFHVNCILHWLVQSIVLIELLFMIMLSSLSVYRNRTWFYWWSETNNIRKSDYLWDLLRRFTNIFQKQSGLWSLNRLGWGLLIISKWHHHMVDRIRFYWLNCPVD